MFYSQTYLGRNGPLSKVWCAAHLQHHRLKKSDCASVNIPKTVDHIMFPDAPIALRLSGHLLLGVVRIYSKQVLYLFKDCHSILARFNKLFIEEIIDLPEDAFQAPFESFNLSMPNSFELDAMDLDLNDKEGDEDHHRKTQEEITIEDQGPTGGGDFIALRFDEDWYGPHVPDTDQPMQQNELDSPVQAQVVPNRGTPPMERFELHSPVRGKDNILSGGGPTEFHQGPGPSVEPTVMIPSDIPRETIPEPETMRDVVDVSVLKDMSSLLPQGPPEEQVNNKVTIFPAENPPTTPGEPFPPLGQNSAPNSSGGPSGEADDVFDAPVSFANASPAMAIRSSPLDFALQPCPNVPQPQNRRRRRKKQFYDENIVLTNRTMKKSLEDTSDILRKRKPLPSSDLGLWKQQKRSRKEQIFHEPLFTGMSRDLGDMFQKGYTIKTRLAPEPEVAEPVSEAVPNNNNVDEQSPDRAPIADMEVDGSGSSENTVPVTDHFPDNYSVHSPPSETHEIERMMYDGSNIGNNTFPDFFPSGSTAMPSSSRLGDFTPFSGNLSPVTEQLNRTTTTTTTTIGTTPHPSVSAGTFGSDLETPMTFSEDCVRAQNARLSDIPELSPIEDDLGFLLKDDDLPTLAPGSSGSRHYGWMSEKTRATAQFLQRHSPTDQTSDGQQPPDVLSLNKILEGKTRKLAAKMFYQTLVLKSSGVIDVQQDKPYEDVSLKLQRQGLSKIHL